MPISDLKELLRSMQPTLNPGVYAFVSVPNAAALGAVDYVATMREPEGVSAVIAEADALTLELPILLRAAWITLAVQSDLQAVGLTAAVATALGQAGIPCNVVAGAWHDHLFVPVDRAEDALAALRRLQRSAPERQAYTRYPMATGELRQTIFPILRYNDAREAIRTLCGAFGFVELFSAPSTGPDVRHAQLRLGASVIMLGSVRPGEAMASPRGLGASTQALYVFVDDLDAHFDQARSAGADIISPPATTDFGAREYHVRDIEGHLWTFGSYLPDVGQR